MKIISMYLPQFHRTKENDEWWGEGFTEWTAVKNAEKIYSDQYQPRIPFNHNYYNLLEKETMIWQADLMKKYEVDGQCFYHYWFKDGRQVLEKPAQNLLRWKEIAMSFCFCWANESWARTWSRIGNKNPWANTFENEAPGQGTGVLLEQKYGREEQWKRHFDYLMPFFKDDRYIKIDGRPVFLIYKTALIPCINDMLKKWRMWAVENGFEGLYIVGANSNQRVDKCLDAVLYHEPQRTMSAMSDKSPDRKGVLKLDYDAVWKEILEFQSQNTNTVYGGFLDYDDTPRRGREGIIIEHASPDKFKIYLAELMAKNEAAGKEFTFLNAWNEWGEGMYLEPDMKYEYGYLEAVQYAKRNYASYLDKYKAAVLGNDCGSAKEEEFWAAKCAKYESYWRVLDAWLYLKEEGILLEQYFINRNIRSIAVYGVGILGRHLLRELENGSVKAAFAIDRKADALHTGIKVYSPEDDFPEADMIVVTAAYAFSEIQAQLTERGYTNVVSLEEIIMESV